MLAGALRLHELPDPAAALGNTSVVSGSPDRARGPSPNSAAK